MASNYLIYALIDPRDNTVFYIGKTRRKARARLDEHLLDFDGVTPKQLRIREIYDSEVGEPDVVVLEDNIATDKAAFTREIFWIELFSMVGANLTNASVDFNGVYFLSNHHLNSLSDTHADTNSHSSINRTSDNEIPSWKVNITPSNDKNDIPCHQIDEDYFKMEFCETYTPTTVGSPIYSKYDLVRKRSQNIAAGRYKNHGIPIIQEEIFLLKKHIDRGDSIFKIVNYFQRSESSIRSILRNNGMTLLEHK